MFSLEAFQQINEGYPWFFAFWAFVFGACWGSFFNVVIYRYPREMSVVKPGSHCFSCGKPIAWYDNLPILSWFILRGKARCCGARFSVRYAGVEALTGLLFLAVWLVYGDNPLAALAYMVFISFLICGLFIDYDTQYLPNACTVGCMLAGFIFCFAVPAMHGQAGDGDPDSLNRIQSLVIALHGAVVGAGVLILIAMVAEFFLRKDAMGIGDVYLMAGVGAFVGWQGAVFSIFGGAFLGTLVVIPVMATNRLLGSKLSVGKTTKAEPLGETSVMESAPETAASGGEATGEEGAELGIGAAIPFGPWLALGSLAYLLVLRVPVDGYFATMRQLIFEPLF